MLQEVSLRCWTSQTCTVDLAERSASFHLLSDKYSRVPFLEVDVDDYQDVAANSEVRCMLTFQSHKRVRRWVTFSGTKREKLEATVNEFALSYPENAKPATSWLKAVVFLICEKV